MNHRKFIALVSGFGWHVQELQRAAKQLDIGFTAIPFETLVGQIGVAGQSLNAGGTSLADVDGVLIRMMPPGSLERVIYRMDALHRLELAGVSILNSPRAVEVSVDKYLSLALLERAGVAVPPTIACESAADAITVFEQLGGDVVVKPLFGSEGRGLMRISDIELARRAFFTLERLGAVLYLQKTIRNSGYDERAFVLDGRVLGAIRRHAPHDDWRTNVAIGGRPETCQLDPKIEQLAIVAARAVGAEMAGIDILHDLDRGEPVVLEVNAVPGWKALSSATGIDVAAEILRHLQFKSRQQ